MSDDRFKKDKDFVLPEGEHLWLPDDVEAVVSGFPPIPPEKRTPMSEVVDIFPDIWPPEHLTAED